MLSTSILCSNHTNIASRIPRSGGRAKALILTMVLLAASLIGGVPFMTGVAAAETGTLKLMVTNCSGTPYDGAEVGVEIHRTGGGIVATESGYTDDGYVEFSFSVLQDGDQAQVTVSECRRMERAHGYTWVSNDADKPGFWDIGETIPRTGCVDGWWDENENIIQCKCE
jgi:hypothetical protein